MGTSCKKCPFKDIKKEEGSCVQMFAKKYHTSCVNYDIDDKIIRIETENTLDGQNKPSETVIDNVTITTPQKVKKTVRKRNNSPKKELTKKAVNVKKENLTH